MPAWPLAPLLALAATVYVMTQQTGGNLEITGWIVLGSVLYFAAYLRAGAPAAGRRSRGASSERWPDIRGRPAVRDALPLEQAPESLRFRQAD